MSINYNLKYNSFLNFFIKKINEAKDWISIGIFICTWGSIIVIGGFMYIFSGILKLIEYSFPIDFIAFLLQYLCTCYFILSSITTLIETRDWVLILIKLIFLLIFFPTNIFNFSSFALIYLSSFLSVLMFIISSNK